MIKEITMKWLEQNGACEELRKAFDPNRDNRPIVVLKRLIADKRYEWANWAIVRIMDRRQYLLYSAFATELAAPNYEKQFPGDDVIRRCVAAVRAVAENDTTENRYARAAALSARYATESAARYAARSALSAAEYALSARAAALSAALSAAESALSAAESARYAAEYARYAAESAARYALYALYARDAALSAAESALSAAYIKILGYGIGLLEEE